MAYFEKNMEMLGVRAPEVYDGIKKYLEENKEESEITIQLTDARDGSTCLTVIDKEGEQHRMNSGYRPLSEAKRWADQYEFRNMKITVIMFGLGNGVFIREMYQRLDKDSLVFLYEPSVDVLIEMLHSLDLTDIFERENLHFFVEGVNGEEFEEELCNKTHWSNLATQIVCYHPVYDRVFEPSFFSFIKHVNDSNKIVTINRDTNTFFAHVMAENSLRNLHFIRESNYISEYVGKFPDELPVFIIAAGPSLDENIEELKKAVGKSLIIATDTAVRRLLEHNIPFDCMVTLDPKKPSRYISDPRCADVPLFCILEANNEIMEFHKGKKIWFRGGRHVEKLYKKYNRIFAEYNPGGSVATAAFSICAALQMKRIVFVGQDLAYKGNVTHAGGEVDHILNEQHGIQMIEGVDGDKVKSRYDWIIYRDWFEDSIKVIPDTDVIDATEGGALIHGTRLMKLKDVIEQYCTIDFDAKAFLNDMPKTYTEKEYQPLKKDILHMEKEFAKIKIKAQYADKCCDEVEKLLKQNGKSDAVDREVRKIADANNEIEKQRAYDMIDQYISGVAAKNLENVFKFSGNEEQDSLDTVKSASVVYKAIVETINTLQDEIKNAFDKVREEQ